MEIRQIRINKSYQVVADANLRFRPKLDIPPVKVPAGQIVVVLQKFGQRNAVYVQWGRVAGWMLADNLAEIAPPKDEAPPEM